ncbi:hypothetical protein TVAG_465110 [Trichomonas vaginalis G3]|uniref:Uncharacterized protein n=1 Tax=Trichomonas vaginalis (strain ATCC PRA-98 / G3) TaxID=412133 RepID=A2DTX6_TRIV3|nr:amelogenin-related protein family [Trichomonas vaginalis G3]EAY16123.1 hypothetical protein TVAG_465110 [Trichomonas vaginalis G3]KAI5510461.1 amelogenin-related protein family [Trichomonas vaginalis G3]|eukprot:XP_001328346.1 hypothetical protein [Trichomonas vaginalis G3]
MILFTSGKFDHGIVITGNKYVEIQPVKSYSATYAVFVAVYDGEASFESDKINNVISPDGKVIEKAQINGSFWTVFSQDMTKDATALIQTKKSQKDDLSYIIDGENSDYVFSYFLNGLAGDTGSYRYFPRITKEKTNSKTVGIIAGIVVAIIIIVIIVVVIVFIKVRKHHKSSSSSPSSSSKKIKKYDNNNADFAQPAGVYPNQGYPPNQPQTYQQQQAPIYSAPLDPASPYQ